MALGYETLSTDNVDKRSILTRCSKDMLWLSISSCGEKCWICFALSNFLWCQVGRVQKERKTGDVIERHTVSVLSAVTIAC